MRLEDLLNDLTRHLAETPGVTLDTDVCLFDGEYGDQSIQHSWYDRDTMSISLRSWDPDQ